MAPLHQLHGHLRIQNLIMQMIFHLEMNWWADIGTGQTNFGNNQNASDDEAHRDANQIALKSPMVVQPSRCLLVPALTYPWMVSLIFMLLSLAGDLHAHTMGGLIMGTNQPPANPHPKNRKKGCARTLVDQLPRIWS